MRKVSATSDFFQYDGGGEFFYVGVSDFGQWKRYNDPTGAGPENLVRPLFSERRRIADAAGYTGPIVARVFRYAHPGNPFGIEPGKSNYSKVNAFMDMAAEYNTYIDWTCGDSQFDFMLPTVQGQQADLDRFCQNIARPCFVETCNEPFENGNLPQNGVKPPASDWYLRDSGYYEFINDHTSWETKYDLDFISFHGDRTNDPIRWPKWVCDLDDSISVLRTTLGRPTVLKEPNKFGAYYTDPSFAKILGLRANMGGVVFHSQKGLESNGFDDSTWNAFGQFCTGAAGALR